LKIFFSLVQAMAFFLMIAYAYCKSPAYRALRPEALSRRDRVVLYLLFSAISIAGTYLGQPVQGAIANTRAVGAVLAGLVGGPLLGLGVGITGGVHRWLLGGFTGVACGLSTTVEGAIGGLVHLWVMRRRGREATFSPVVALATTVVAEAAQMLIILAVARPFTDALALVQVIALPMLSVNSAGAAVFMSIIKDRQSLADQLGAASTAKALRIAERTLALLAKGFSREAAPELARIIHQETGVGAVAVTDTERILAYVGEGEDHHRPGDAICSDFTKRAIAQSEVMFANGVDEPYVCPVSPSCPLRSALVVPLHVDGEVIGTIKLYERANRRFLNINRTLGEGLTALFASQLLHARFHEQKQLMVVSELKLARAQVNPHFLFNSLATIMAIMRKDPERARSLLNHLSNFFRMNLKRSCDLSTLEEELSHVTAYLEIEKARYEEQLAFELDIDPTLMKLRLPTFTLQPLLENAIKHGISEMLTPGTARIHAYRQDGEAVIDVEDDAGAFDEHGGTRDGLGISIVDRRIRNLLGAGAGVSIECVPCRLTRVSIRVPITQEAA
jgi:two-component system LytT family sensor kinase